MFNDGPLDALGNFLNSSKNKNGGNRHLDLLDDIKDKIEDQFDGLQDEIKGQVQDQVEDLGSKIKGQGPVQDVTNGLKTEATQLTNGAQLKDGGVKATAAGTCDPSNPNVRFEWANYQNADRTAFVQAIKCLMGKPSGGAQYAGAQNRYEDLVSVHRDMTANIHQTASFLVWHRYFVWVFEQMLRQECGFDRAMPWWDETKNAGAFAASDIFSDAWFGQLPAKTSDGQGTCIESGAFAGTTLHVGPGSANQDHCLSRAVDESQTAQCNSDFTNSCLSRGAYDDFRNCFELGPHGYGHNGIGAVMAEVSSSVGDPIFFMHHLFVDHTFRIWQNADSSRLTTISGCADSANPCTPISLDTKLSSSGLQPDLTVGQVLNTLGGSLCYRYDY
ncbi:Di-copper centre-containing protein [Xylariaceae sp. FL1651]|nr:Di-copper centre-containing protein [Xylariaceae sp. FL1651]